jgi:hypothetical protein
VPPQFFKAALCILSIQRDKRAVDTLQAATGLEIRISLLLPKAGFLLIGEFFHLTPP